MLPGYPTRNWYRKSEIRGVQAAFKVTKRRVLYDRHQFSDSSCSSLWSPGTRMHPPHCRPRIEAYEREVKVDATVCGTSEPGEDLRRFSQYPFTQTWSPAMNFIGVDLHKKSITLCVLNENLKVLARKTVFCDQTDEIVEFFRQFRPFRVVVEATASYVWFVELVEPLAEKVVLANPKKLRVIA